MSLYKPTTRSDFLIGGLVLNFILLLAWAGSIWSYSSYSEYLLDIIDLQRPLLVFQKQQTALLFGWISVLSICVAMNIEIIFVRLLRRSVPSILAKVQKWAAWVMFLGIGLAVFGGLLVNPIWAYTFKEAGYSRCNTVIVRANKQFFNDAWVLEPADCYDRGLKQILHEDHGKRGFEKGARYLEKKHQFLQSRKAVHNPGAGL